MKLKSVIFVVLAIALIGGGVFLLNSEYSGYSIICFAVAFVLLLFGVSSIINNSNPVRRYQSTVREILSTFDSVLVKSNSVPKLENRNIILLESMDDLIDAQLEIRKPICYLKQTESCSFVLLDDKEAYIYIEKLNDDVVSPVEIEIKDLKVKKKNADEMDSEMLRDIEKTTIVKLSNKKSYKVSPVRKNKPPKEDNLVVEELDEKEEVKPANNDEIEILDF